MTKYLNYDDLQIDYIYKFAYSTHGYPSDRYKEADGICVNDYCHESILFRLKEKNLSFYLVQCVKCNKVTKVIYRTVYNVAKQAYIKQVRVWVQKLY